MAILSNINDLFRVDSAGAVYFATSAGANLQVLQSVGTGGSPIWVDVDDIIGGPYLPLAGGILTGNLALTDATNNPSLVISTGSLTVGGATTLNSTLAGTSATFSGNITIGSTSKTTNTVVQALSNDDVNAGFEARGASQGTGYFYAGQSASHGGGMFYNGNGVPAFAAGESNDAISFYRRAANVQTVVFDFMYNSNTVRFKGGITLAGSITGTTGTFSGLVSGITPTAASNFTTKDYVDNLSPPGGPYLPVANPNFTGTLEGPIFSGDVTASGDGQSNYPFRLGTDYSAYMVAAASNTWGLFWAGSGGARYGTNGLGGPGDIWSNSTNPNEFCFVGSDTTRWSVAGGTGDTWQQGNIYLSGTFIRANNNLTLQVDGAGTPVGAITIDNVGSTTFSGYTYFPNYLFHEGDTNTRIQFTTGTITLRGDTSIVLDGPTTTNANFTGTTAGFSGSISASGNSNSFGNTTIAALSASTGTFSSSVTAAGNSNSFGNTSTGALSATTVGVTNIVTNVIPKFNGTIFDDSLLKDDGTLTYNGDLINTVKEYNNYAGKQIGSDTLLEILESDNTATLQGKLNYYNSAVTRVEDSTAPAGGCFELNNKYASITIPGWFKVEAGQEYTFEVWAKFISGTDADQRIYAGSSFYDANKGYLGNSQRYWGESGFRIDSNNNNDGWYFISGTLGPTVASGTGNIPTTAKWMRLIMLLNYSSNANVIRLCGLRYYKSGGVGAKLHTSIYRKAIGSEAGTSAGAWLGRQVMDTSGNLYGANGTFTGDVGINTTLPSANLEVFTSTGGAGVNTLRLNTNFANGNAVDINPFITGTNNGGLEIKLNGAQKLVMLPSGNVGIGTTTPAASAKLTVMGNQTFGLPGNGTNTSGRFISIEGNTDGSGEGSGRIFFTEHNSTTGLMDSYGMSLGYRGGATSIVGASGNTWTGLTQIGNGQWGMWGHNNNATGSLIMSGDRAATYISIPSNVGIGNTTPQTTLHVGTITTVTNQFTNQVAASNFFVNGNANGGASFFQCKTAAVNINMMGNNDFACNQFTFYHKPLSTSQNVVGTIATFSSSTQYNTTSDYRLKENIIPLSDSIIRLKKLKPSRFNFIEDPERIMDGFLAHEVQDIVPEAVNGEKDAVDKNGNEVHQGIDQAKLVPLLVAAIQELEARIKELENK